MNATKLKAFIADVKSGMNIDLRYDQLPSGALPNYDRTKGTITAGLGTFEAIGSRVLVKLTPGAPNPESLGFFLSSQPGHKHYRLPVRTSGDEVLEWGLVAFS